MEGPIEHDERYPEGLYEQLLSAAGERRLVALGDPRLVDLGAVDPEDS